MICTVNAVDTTVGDYAEWFGDRDARGVHSLPIRGGMDGYGGWSGSLNGAGAVNAAVVEAQLTFDYTDAAEMPPPG